MTHHNTKNYNTYPILMNSSFWFDYKQIDVNILHIHYDSDYKY